MSWTSCLVGLPKINWAQVNRENAEYYSESYWCVVHMETHRVWRRSACWDRTDYWDKTHPIRGFYNAEKELRRLRSGDIGLWKLREVSPYTLEHDCKKTDKGYEFNKLEYPA